MTICNSHNNKTIDEGNGEEAKDNQIPELAIETKSNFSESTDTDNFKKVQKVQLQGHRMIDGVTKSEEK